MITPRYPYDVCCTSYPLPPTAGPLPAARLRPVLEAANCCCKQTSTAPQAKRSCCQHHAPAPKPGSTCCRVPSADICGCCVASAPLTTTPRTALRLAATAAYCDFAGTDQAAPTVEVNVNRHFQQSSPCSNRRQAALCCWRN
ncbi:MAG UNVERIFIED_CONTAM: hypothetical protein LVR18_15675 [Planctomycetaceae bacterium]